MYMFMFKHFDIRHIMGTGIAITREKNTSLSFCYSMLLFTMYQNLITKIFAKSAP